MSTNTVNKNSVANNTPLTASLALQHDLYDLADTILTTRAVRALEDGAARYPIHRLVRCAAKRPLVAIFDDLALNMGLAAMRLEAGVLLLDGPGAFIHAKGSRKADYCSCEFNVWADSITHAETLSQNLLTTVGERIDHNKMFTLEWYFFNSRNGLISTTFEETAHESLHDAAYPYLNVPIATFIEHYLNADETVLVLQGPPGTGKTRLVRAILAGLSQRKDESAKVMYTADKHALEHDEIFVEFITGSHDVFVIEDADHLLKARHNGNQDLHRFLTIADGIARAQKRKIIFTTNLPNITDIDDALLRPGRCFASLSMRLLLPDEALRLAHALSNDAAQAAATTEALFTPGVRTVSVARVYQQIKDQR